MALCRKRLRICVFQTRFQQLFAFRKKYTIEELRPYITNLVGKPGQLNEAELLLKYTRKVDSHFVSI